MAKPGDKDERGFVKVRADELAKLQPFAEQVGADIPGLIEFQPKVDIDATVSEVGRLLGAMCSRQPIFRQAGGLVAIDDFGELIPVTEKRFGSWVEKFVTTVRWTKERGEHAYTIPKDLAGRIMETDGFVSQVRPLNFYFPVRMPVERPDGSVELLPPGYDLQTQSWTEDSVPYDEHMDHDDARDWIYQNLEEWPWADKAGAQDWSLSKSRDASVILGGMLGVYCRAFFRPGQKRPMIVTSGNQPGTGKTTLAKMVMAPTYGLPPEMDLPPTEEKFSRLLESVALSMAPFLFLDDVGRKLKSTALNKFVTASNHGGTKLYTQATFSVPAVTQVIASGNDLETDDNAKRRMMWSELFLPGEVQGRDYKFEVTDTLLGETEWRAKTLAALWSIVRLWADRKSAGALPAKRKELKSFERYCRIIGPMVDVFGWRDPFEEAPGISGGDTESRDFKDLLTVIADGLEDIGEFTTSSMVERARGLKVLESLVGTSDDGALNKNDRIRFGKRLEKYRGRVWQRTDGKFFQFGKRDGKGGSIYPCRIEEKAEDLF